MTLPNQLTILRILLTPVFVWLFFAEQKLWATMVFIIASLTDWYDGYIARKFGYVTEWGKFLDPLADKILVLSTFISFSILGYIKLWMLITIIVRDALVTGLRTYASFRKKPIITSYWAKVKTFSQMAVIYLILLLTCADEIFAFDKNQNQIVISVIEKTMWFVIILTVYTGLHYFIENRKQLVDFVKQFYRVFVTSE
jgi:CDP-diacylglycerol--glycerol-3-phosphate 3-phosphatidyltransferase